MALFKSGNPALDKETFSQCEPAKNEIHVMTIGGTVNKTAFLLILTIVSSFVSWHFFFTSFNWETTRMIVVFGSIIGLALAFFIVFNKDLAAYLAPIYAIFEGLSLGGLSAIFENAFPGIVIQSLALTFSIFFTLLVIYKFGIIKVSENLKLIIASATSGIALYYFASFGLRFFGIELPFIHESTMGGIIFSVFVVVLAAVNLVVDFDFIEQGVEHKVPKYMEWYGAFGLLITVIWLYLEILRLLGKSRKR